VSCNIINIINIFIITIASVLHIDYIHRHSHVYYVSSRYFIFPRDALQCKARSCYRMPSARPSVTLVDHDHIGLKSNN